MKSHFANWNYLWFSLFHSWTLQKPHRVPSGFRTKTTSEFAFFCVLCCDFLQISGKMSPQTYVSLYLPGGFHQFVPQLVAVIMEQFSLLRGLLEINSKRSFAVRALRWWDGPKSSSPKHVYQLRKGWAGFFRAFFAKKCSLSRQESSALPNWKKVKKKKYTTTLNSHDQAFGWGI